MKHQVTHKYVQHKEKLWLCLLHILYTIAYKIGDLVQEQTT